MFKKKMQILGSLLLMLIKNTEIKIQLSMLQQILIFFNSLWSFCETFDLQTISRLQKGWQLFLTYIDFSCIHKLEYRLQMAERYVLKYNNRMFRRVFLQQSFEVRATSRQDHFVRLACLSFTSQCHVREALLVPQVFER